MKLKYQLFITLLVASALLIALMLAISSYSFHRGFLGYINTTERDRLEPLVGELAAIYEANGDWEWIKNNRRQWNELIGQYDIQPRQPKEVSLMDGNRNKSKQYRQSTRPKRENAPDPKSTKRRPPPPPRGAAWLVLTDAEKKPLLGKISPNNKIDWLPIDNNDKTVGYLGHKRRNQLNRKIDQAFAQQQKRSFGYAALGMILFSGLLSVPLGSRIVKPLLTVNNAVGEINQGNFNYRVNINRNDELGDLARNVNNLGFTLEQNLAARQRWIAEISHELRTPLAVLQGEIEAIQDGIRKADPTSINSLHSEVMRLNRLINDLHQLSLSDIGGLEYQMQPMPLNDIVSEYVESNISNIESASLQLHLNTETALVFGDYRRITQLLDNLLQNSIRYTATPGVLDISVAATSDKAILRWSDSSPGVEDKDHKHLFDPLYRTDESRNRANGGSGLGLAIVSKIVDAHSGTINAQHSHLGGLEIIISIPLEKERSS